MNCKKLSNRSLVIVMSVVLLIVFSTWALAEKPTIVVGSKNFTEQYITAEMIALLLEYHGYPVERKYGLGGNAIIFPAILRGDIHVYPEYAGTAYGVHLGHELDPGLSKEYVYGRSRTELKEKYDLIYLDSYGFNNTYVFVTTQETFEETGAKNLSELAPYAHKYSVGGSIDYMGERPDGHRGVEEVYDMKFARTRAMDSGLFFQALQLGQVDFVVAFSTHGQIAALDLVIVEDDKDFFPPYHKGTIIRGDILRENPEIQEVLDLMVDLIDEPTMARLNYKVDGEREEPDDVAREFLIEVGLISE